MKLNEKASRNIALELAKAEKEVDKYSLIMAHRDLDKIEIERFSTAIAYDKGFRSALDAIGLELGSDYNFTYSDCDNTINTASVTVCGITVNC